MARTKAAERAVAEAYETMIENAPSAGVIQSLLPMIAGNADLTHKAIERLMALAGTETEGPKVTKLAPGEGRVSSYGPAAACTTLAGLTEKIGHMVEAGGKGPIIAAVRNYQSKKTPGNQYHVIRFHDKSTGVNFQFDGTHAAAICRNYEAVKRTLDALGPQGNGKSTETE